MRRLNILIVVLALSFLVTSCEDDDDPGLGAYQPGDIVDSVPVNDKVVALTYDDGPNEPYTSMLLDVLKEGGAKATFFLVGNNVDTYPDVVGRIRAEGHEIGNHTYDHLPLRGVPASVTRAEIENGEAAILAAVGVRPRLFRSPHGVITTDLSAICNELGYVIIGWSVSGHDWDTSSATGIARSVLNAVHPGAIILLHDGEGIHLGTDRMPTVEATRIILQELSTRGYRTVTVPELLRH